MKMMVGDNLGETQLQQLVDRQLAGQPRGPVAVLISRVEVLGQCCSWLSICPLWNPIDNFSCWLAGSPTTNLMSYSFKHLMCDDKKQQIVFPYCWICHFPTALIFQTVFFFLSKSQQRFFLEETISLFSRQFGKRSGIIRQNYIPWNPMKSHEFIFVNVCVFYMYIYIHI